MPTSRRRSRPYQTIRHGYAYTLEENLHTSTMLKDVLALARDGATYGSFVEKELDLAPGTYTKYSRTNARSQSPRHHQEEETQQAEEGPQIFHYNPNSDLEYGEQENEFAIQNGFWNLVAELQGLNPEAEPFVPEPRAE
jgi:hypothetical protein